MAMTMKILNDSGGHIFLSTTRLGSLLFPRSRKSLKSLKLRASERPELKICRAVKAAEAALAKLARLKRTGMHVIGLLGYMDESVQFVGHVTLICQNHKNLSRWVDTLGMTADTQDGSKKSALIWEEMQSPAGEIASSIALPGSSCCQLRQFCHCRFHGPTHHRCYRRIIKNLWSINIIINK